MPIRRHCDPINVQRIWDAIRTANVAHMACDLNKIVKALQKKEPYVEEQVKLYVNQCLKDGLIIISRKSMTNGDPTNVSYKVTDQQLPEFDGKDWYCFECHLAGDVNLCEGCYRVFHTECVQKARQKFNNLKRNKSLSALNANNEPVPSGSDISTGCDNSSNAKIHFDDKLCSICNIAKIDERQLDPEELNHLLKFVLRAIRIWLPNGITHTQAEEERPTWLTDTELTWRTNQLLLEHRDFSVIEVNLNTQSYQSITDFLADIYTVQHNAAIFHGTDSVEYRATKLMLQDTEHDVLEIQNCSDCYKHSNEKINSHWFSLPCRSPHKLVWAKQKGFPYWPAKVIRETDSHADVRFFGGKHERSIIQKSSIKPISVPKESLKIKGSGIFKKALEELEYHQKLLVDPQELNKILSSPKNKKTLRKSTSTILNNSVVNDNSAPVEQANKRKTPVIATVPTATEPKIKMMRVGSEETSSQAISGNVISISDCEDEEENGGYSFSRRSSVTRGPFRFEDNYEQVSSSTENCRNSNHEAELHKLDQPYSDSVEEMRRKLESIPDKNAVIKCAMDSMQTEIDRLTNERNDYLKKLFESHNAQISETKKKQWCYNCEQDAIYYCCWNTAYCSQICQQQHWQAEHKRVCRRKRQA